MTKPKLTQDFVRSILDYDAELGVLRWKERTPETFEDTEKYSLERKCLSWNRHYAGKVAGSPTISGSSKCIHLGVRINGVAYKAHILIWLIMTGEYPTDEIDHEDTDGLNNRWRNLRLATPSQNKANIGVRRNNKLGLKGVCKVRNRYKASIQVNNEKKHLGYADTPEGASKLYLDAAMLYYGEFARG